MPFQCRLAIAGDVPRLAVLLDDYMQEAFHRPWNGSAEALSRDVFGSGDLVIHLLEAAAEVVAFAAWRPTYDLHHCAHGVEIIDLYVCPEQRIRGAAVVLVAAVAAAARSRGAQFLKGQSVEIASARRLYERLATCYPGADCFVSGRAFRALADGAGLSARDLARSLPPKAWNLEP